MLARMRDGDRFAMFRRAKLLFGDIPTAALRAAHEGAGVLVGRLSLTGADGGPRCPVRMAIVKTSVTVYGDDCVRLVDDECRAVRTPRMIEIPRIREADGRRASVNIVRVVPCHCFVQTPGTFHRDRARCLRRAGVGHAHRTDDRCRRGGLIDSE